VAGRACKFEIENGPGCEFRPMKGSSGCTQQQPAGGLVAAVSWLGLQMPQFYIHQRNWVNSH